MGIAKDLFHVWNTELLKQLCTLMIQAKYVPDLLTSKIYIPCDQVCRRTAIPNQHKDTLHLIKYIMLNCESCCLIAVLYKTDKI